jgi:signal transduction histidine kinase
MSLIVLTLLVFSAVLYHHLSKKLNSNLDSLLKLWANGVVDSIETYWETERLEAMEDGQDGHIFLKRNNINFSKIAKRWVDEKSKDPNLVNIIIQIFDARSQLIVSTKDISELVPSGDAAPLFKSAKDEGVYEILTSESDTGQIVGFRAFTRPVIENGHLAYSVKVISQSTEIDSTLDYLKLLLFILLPITVVAAGIISTSLAQKTLGQVDHMIDTLRQVTEKNMALRIGTPNTGDEINELAKTLNDMLSRLEDSFGSQKKFMEEVTHELKTPLAILKGEIESYLKTPEPEEGVECLLKSNLEEVNRLTKIVEDLLMLARLDTHVLSLEMNTLDLSSLVREMAEVITILTQQKNIMFSDSITSGIVIMGDKNQLNRLFLNILDNAVKYTPAGGSIHLSLKKSQDGQHAVLSIKDTGIGIPVEDLANIFERFYRVEPSGIYAGSGLGLCIAKTIAEVHGGIIQVESLQGQGSMFTITLPSFSSQH